MRISDWSSDVCSSDLADDAHRHDAAHLDVVGHADDAVDLGCLAVAARHAGSVDEHVCDGAAERVPSGGGDAVLELSQLGQPLVHEAPWHRAAEGIGRASCGGGGRKALEKSGVA